jgi:hypothetical protein
MLTFTNSATGRKFEDMYDIHSVLVKIVYVEMDDLFA